MSDASSLAPLDSAWRSLLAAEFDKPYLDQLGTFLRAEIAAGKIIYPSRGNWFRALNLTPPEQVRVVILGQDPYHGSGQADGLCFSVQPGIALPPSLRNIYKEIGNELGIEFSVDGCLDRWARQGVLLLNSILTVEESKPGSHQGKGWERFTDEVIRSLNASRNHLVFLLWGSYAQQKGALLDSDKHLILRSAHPSPLAAYRGFFGNGHFTMANDYLRQQGIAEIDW